MGFLKDAILYVNDRNRTGMEGFLTRYEELYPFLPRPASVLTSAKASTARTNSRDEPIHQTNIERA